MAAYTRTTWANGSGGGTPISAANLNNMEVGILEAGRELSHVEFTSNVSITATTAATANTIVTAAAITFDGSTPVLIEFYAPFWNHGTIGANMKIVFYEGSTEIGEVWRDTATAASTIYGLGVGARRLTPGAGSKTYSARGYVSTGTGTVGVGAGGAGNQMPGYIRVTRA